VDRTGWPADRIRQALAAAAGGVLSLNADGTAWIGAEAAAQLRGEVLRRMEDHDRRNPYAPGINKQELRSLLAGSGDEAFVFTLRILQAEGRIDADAERLMLAGRRVEVESSLAGAIAGVEAELRRCGIEGLADAALRELLARAGRADASAVDFLLKSRRLVRVGPDYYVHPDTLAEVIAAFRARLSKGDPLEVALCKDLFGLTRKRAIPLLEYLDRQGVTRRAGANRFLC
jgi:selenocysteine-specific elongation factor